MSVEGAKRIRKTVSLDEREPVARPFAEDDATAGGTKIKGGGVDGGRHVSARHDGADAAEIYPIRAEDARGWVAVAAVV